MKLLAALTAAICLLGAGVAIGTQRSDDAALARQVVAQDLGAFLAGPGERSRVEVGRCRQTDRGDTRCRFKARSPHARCEGEVQVRETPRSWLGWARQLRCR